MSKKILDNLVGEERLLIATACDKAAQAVQRQQPYFTTFLDPGQRALLSQYDYLWDATMDSFGGYAEAERQIVAFSPGLVDYPLQYPLVAVAVSGNFNFATVTHRDYLGSLLALGIKRDTVGDILVGTAGCQLVLQQTIASYVLANWQAVGKVGIKVAEIPVAELKPPEPKIVWRQATVASLRLDAIVAVAYAISRTQAATLIRGGKFKHNFVVETRCDKTVAIGETLSLAVQGRAQLREIGGQSRKGRWYVQIAHFV